MTKSWKTHLNDIRSIESKIKLAKSNLSKLKRTRHKTEQVKSNIDIMVNHIDTLNKRLNKTRRLQKWAIINSLRSEEQKRKIDLGAFEDVGEHGELSLREGMQFLARFIDIVDRDENATKQITKEAMVKFPLRMKKSDTRQLGKWYFASMADDCAEAVVSVIEQRKMGIKISEAWAATKRRLSKPSEITGRMEVTMERYGQSGEVKAIKPDHPLIWTGMLLESIEGWSEWQERAAYFGVRKKGKIHTTGLDIADVAGILMYNYNFLWRPAVRRMVMERIKQRTEELINILVG